MFRKQRQKGFTVVELVVVVGIYAVLLSYTLKGTVKPQVTTSIDSSITQLVSDIKQQQIKSMIGFTADENSAQQFGIYFSTNSYTLFTGSSYSVVDPNNFVVELSDGLSFSNITFPSSQVVFDRRSGEVTGFVEGSNGLSIVHEDTSVRSLEVNKYGAITLY